LLALVCWFAACAGVQLLHPQSLLNFPGWWLGQWITGLSQLVGVLLSAWLLRHRSPLAQWLALLAWWAWPWQDLPQWLRVTPGESVWQLTFGIWLLSLVQQRLTAAWLATLVMALLWPASLAGAAAGLAVTGQGRHRWVALAIAGLAMLVDFQPAGWEQLAWGGLAVALVWVCAEPATRVVACYTLLSAAKGGPTTSALLALAVAWAVERWGGVRPLVFGVGSWALAQAGETALNRQLIVPWQKQGVSLGQALLPHSLTWWAEHIGSRYGLSGHDQEVWQWLRGQPLGTALVCHESGVWDDPLVAQVYSQLSGGRVLAHPSPWGLEAVKRADSWPGSGLDWVIRRGSQAARGSVFRSGAVGVWKNATPQLPATSVSGFEVLEAAGPGGVMEVNARCEGPVGVSKFLPRVVLQPGLNRIGVPLYAPRMEDGAVLLPARDLAQQLQATRVSCARGSVPSQCIEVVTLQVHNASSQSLHLESLAGLRLRWPGEPWQPRVATPVRLGPGQRGQLQVPVQTPAQIARLWLELAWEEPSGRRHPAGRLRFDVWPQQHPERYLGIKPAP
jgi:hypothetical protein